jgi:hypothetical protein
VAPAELVEAVGAEARNALAAYAAPTGTML